MRHLDAAFDFHCCARRQVLPWRFVVIGNDWLEITSGTSNINADGTFSMTFSFRESSSGQVSTF